MIFTETDTYQIQSDGSTVWVNKPILVGRFSRFGVDIHRLPTEQSEKGQCLNCTHKRPTLDDWRMFVSAMVEHYGVPVTNKHQPAWLDAEESND